MKEKLRFLGLDVHAETIAVAVAEPEGEVRSLGTIPNRAESIRKMIKKLGPADKLRACYEAGPTGYVVYWQLAGVSVSRAEAFSRNHGRPHGSAAFSLHQDAASAIPSRSHPISQASAAAADHPGSARGGTSHRF